MAATIITNSRWPPTYSHRNQGNQSHPRQQGFKQGQGQQNQGLSPNNGMARPDNRQTSQHSMVGTHPSLNTQKSPGNNGNNGNGNGPSQ